MMALSTRELRRFSAFAIWFDDDTGPSTVLRVDVELPLR
jgi:hypothetical protein